MAANWRGCLRVGSILTETPSVKTFRLMPPSGDPLLPFTFLSGQVLNLAFSIGGARMNRSYSISSSPTQREYVDLTVKRDPRGAVSRHLVDLLKVGNQIEAAGPVGRLLRLFGELLPQPAVGRSVRGVCQVLRGLRRGV